MKKIVKTILSLGLVGILAVGGVGCGKEVVSAYDIAVKNGFAGTETEWLSSLRGANGEDGEDLDAHALYEAAKKEGFTGTFLDFCKTLNITVPENNDTVQIAENVRSVVSIYCGYSKTVTSSEGNAWWGGTPSTSTEYGSQAGSGVIVELNEEAGNAYILTNYHVIYNKDSDQKGILDEIWVYPFGAYNAFSPNPAEGKGDGIKATFVGGAMDYDIAVLKIEGSEILKNSNATAAVMGNSSTVLLGEETFVIGNPAGAGIAVTNGVLSVQSEYITIEALDGRDTNRDGVADGVRYRVMRTSAAINSGNSGGGMFNVNGELIGIVNAKSASSTTDNMGYALPISQVKAVYENILANAESKVVKQAMLGVTVYTQASHSVLDADGHVSVFEEFCVKDQATDAEKHSSYGKLRAGDIFKKVRVNDGETLTFTRQYELTEVLLSVRLGDVVHFTVCDTNGEEKVVSIEFNKPVYFTTFG